MRNFFSADGKFYTLCSRIADMAILSVLTLLGSLPVITVIPAWSALNYSLKKSVIDERGRSYREYIAFFKKHFKTGIKYGIAVIVIFAVFMFVLWKLPGPAAGSLSAASLFFGVVSFIILLLTFSFALWFCILSAHDVVPQELLVKLTVVLAVKKLPVTLLVLGAFAVSIILTVISPPLVLLLPAGISLLCIRLSSSTLSRFDPK